LQEAFAVGDSGKIDGVDGASDVLGHGRQRG